MANKRTRKRTFPLLEKQVEPELPPYEMIRRAFPELTRCDHCGKLDVSTLQFDMPDGKRWLHQDCAQVFRPVECHVVTYCGASVYRPGDELGDDDDEEDEEEVD